MPNYASREGRLFRLSDDPLLFEEELKALKSMKLEDVINSFVEVDRYAHEVVKKEGE